MSTRDLLLPVSDPWPMQAHFCRAHFCCPAQTTVRTGETAAVEAGVGLRCTKVRSRKMPETLTFQSAYPENPSTSNSSLSKKKKAPFRPFRKAKSSTFIPLRP